MTHPTSREERDDAARQRIERAAALDWTPAEIAAKVSLHVVGQEEAVSAASVALYQHLRTRVHEAARGRTALPPLRIAPILLIGPTGCGKSQLLRAVSRLTGLPAYVGDASALTAEGWHGASTADWVRALVNMSDGFVPLAEVGLLMVDEIDKKAARGTYGRDIGGADAQDSLLRLLDAGHVDVEALDSVNGVGQRVRVPIRVDSMLVWASGAFSGGGGCNALLDIVARRLRGRGRIGFGASAEPSRYPSRDELRRAVTPADLIAYGMKPELVGRLQRVVVMSELSADAMRSILCDVPDGPIRTAQDIALRLGFRFEFARTLVDEIVRRAAASGLGARALGGLVAAATEAAWMRVPELMRDRRRYPRWSTVVMLRRDSLETGWFGVRVDEWRRRAATHGDGEPQPADHVDSGPAVGRAAS